MFPILHDERTELAALLAEAYDIICNRDALLLIADGRSRVYRLDNHAVSLAVKTAVITPRCRSRISCEASVLSGLHEQQGLVQRVVKTIAGAAFAEHDNRLVLVTKFVHGRPAPETLEGFAIVGAALGTLHMAMDALPGLVQSLPKLDPVVVLRDSYSAIEKRIDSSTAHALQRRVELLCDEFQKQALSNTLDEAGHGDAHGYNLLLTPTDEPVWIDFEDAFAGPRVYDLATVVWSSLRHVKTQPLWSAALGAYNQTGPASTNFAHIQVFVALRQLWWLALHARSWGLYRTHRDLQQFFCNGLDLFEIICRDACGIE